MLQEIKIVHSTRPAARVGALPELALALSSQVSNQPVRVEGVLRRHAPAHDGVEEGFPLAGVEPEDLRGDHVVVDAGDVNNAASLTEEEEVRALSSRDTVRAVPRCCPRLAPGGAAGVCPSRSSAAGGSVCVHLKR